MKTRKWFLRIAGGFVALVILLTLASAVLVSMRQRALKPLDREELARLGIAVPDKNVSADLSVEPGTASGASSAEGGNTAQGPLDDGKPTDASPSADTVALADATSTTPRLARAATAAEWKSSHSPWDEEENPLPYWMRLRASVACFKCLDSVRWLTGSFRGNIPLIVAQGMLELGDDRTTAREYMGEALSDPNNEYCREMICAELAWVEDDPEVATALLERSCAKAGIGEEFAFYNAMHLAIVTHSDELADSYFGRWSKAAGPEKVAQWLAGEWWPQGRGTDSETEAAWKKRHNESDRRDR